MFNKDFGKRVTDLLKQDSFPTSPAVEIETVPASDLKVTVKGSAENDGKILTAITSVWNFNAGKELKTEFKKKGEIANTLTLKFPSVPGLTVVTGVTLSSKDSNANLGFDYLFARGTGSVKFNFPDLQFASPEIDLGFVLLPSPTFAFGVAANIKPDHETQKVGNLAINGQYTDSYNTVNVGLAFSPSAASANAVVGFYRHLNADTGVALQVDYKQQEKKDAVVKVAGGVRRRYGSATLRAVIDTDVNLLLGYEVPLNAAQQLKVGSKIDLKNQHHTSGFTLVFRS